jgi:hypothetical protein
VLGRARHVRVARLERLGDAVIDRPVPAWDRGRHYSGAPERTTAYLLVLDTINFSFWGGHTGYWELAVRLRDVFQGDDSLADPARLAKLTSARLGELLGPMPMLEQRAQALRELGRRGLDGLVGKTAAATARALAESLASYADVVEYDGRDVPFLKRAQIVPADLHGAGLVSFPDLADLTCFADYKLPQLLRHFGALEYSEPLRRRVDGYEELTAGEPMEVEIRAATVVAVERLRDALARRGRQVCAMEVDWILWDLSHHVKLPRPYHRVRTIFY